MTSVSWDGVGVASGAMTTTAAGSGDRPFDTVSGATQAIVAGTPTTITQDQASGAATYLEWRLAESTTWGLEAYFTTPATWPTASVALMSLFTAAGATAVRWDLTTTGTLRIRNATAQVGSATPALSLSTRYLLRAKATLATSGSADLEVWSANGSTLVASLAVTGDFGSTSPWARFGNVLASSQLGKVSWSHLVATNTYAFPPMPAAANQAPVANAGPDQTVDPNIVDTITLDGSGSTDPDGTIASYLWQDITSGTTQVGTTASVTVPLTGLRTTSGSTRTYRCTVTDAGGLTGTDTVVVTLLPHTTWVNVAGVVTPHRIVVP